MVPNVDHIKVKSKPLEPPAQFYGELWSWKELFVHIDFVLVLILGDTHPPKLKNQETNKSFKLHNSPCNCTGGSKFYFTSM